MKIFVTGRLPHSACFLSAINNSDDVKFLCEWLGEEIDMDVEYVYLPYFKGSWLIIDDYAWQEDGNKLDWSMSTGHPVTKCVVAPTYILAVYHEASKVLAILNKTRWEKILDLPRAELGALKQWFRDNRMFQTTKYLSSFRVRVKPHKKPSNSIIVLRKKPWLRTNSISRWRNSVSRI